MTRLSDGPTGDELFGRKESVKKKKKKPAVYRERWIMQKDFDRLTDNMSDAIDQLMNYLGGGEQLAGAREQLTRLRALLRELRGEEQI